MPSHIAWPSVPKPRSTGHLKMRVSLGEARQRTFFGDDFAVGFAHGDAIAVGERIITPSMTAWPPTRLSLRHFREWEELDMREKTQETAQVQ